MRIGDSLHSRAGASTAVMAGANNERLQPAFTGWLAIGIIGDNERV